MPAPKAYGGRSKRKDKWSRKRSHPSPHTIERWIEATFPDYHFGVVLLLLLVTYGFEAGAPTGSWTRVVNTGLQGLTLLAALRASVVSRGLFRIAALVVAVAFLSSCLSLFVSSSNDTNAGFRALDALMVVGAPVAIARSLWHRPTIDIQTALGAICIYVLIGLLFSSVYFTIGQLGSDPFFVQTSNPDASDYLYFSFVTLTTVGYGDYTAAAGLGRSLASIEALLGQVYPVTIVAVIVSNMRHSARHTATQQAVTQAGDEPATLDAESRGAANEGLVTRGISVASQENRRHRSHPSRR